MILDEIPFELKEHIFTYVTPNEWINTAEVSTEWLTLTLRGIKKVESCHLLILDHLAEFINQQMDTNYTWVSLLTMMPRLEHLECIENTEEFWQEISTICRQLKILHFKPRNPASFDWNKLDIRFNNLVELHWDGTFQGRAFPIKLIAFSPKLEKIKLTNVEFNPEWKNPIPKSVKHIWLKKSTFKDGNLLNNLCEDTSVLKTFSAKCLFPSSIASMYDDYTRLKKIEFLFSDVATSLIIKNAFLCCQSLETVEARCVNITESWRRVIPRNVKSMNFRPVKVKENIRHEFSLDWLFQNYDGLQSLELRYVDWTGLDSRKFRSTGNLKKLVLDDNMSYVSRRRNSMHLFSDICARMIRGSHLVHVEICKLNIDESWRHIFPATIKRLKLEDFRLSREAAVIFSPQFICENPSNIEILILVKCMGYPPTMDVNAFTGMQRLQELNLNDIRSSHECFQSILTHCSALTHLLIGGLTNGALSNIPRNLILPSLRKLYVKEPVDKLTWLLQHFPKVSTLDIPIDPSVDSFSDILQGMQEVEIVEIRICGLNWHLVRSLIESIDDVNFKYFCLTCEKSVVSFYFTNSLLYACSKLNDVLIFKEHHKVLKINNYPTSSVLRENVSRVPSSMDELLQRCNELMA